MKQNLLTILIFCSFGFFLVGSLGYLMTPSVKTEQEVIAEAKKNIPAVNLPPKPQGQTVSETKTRQTCTKIPIFKGFKMQFQNKCVSTPYVTQKFVGPTSDDMANWERTVSRVQREYSKTLELEVRKLEAENRVDFVSAMKDTIQILTGLFGMIFGVVGMVLAIRSDRREADKHAKEMAANEPAQGHI